MTPADRLALALCRDRWPSLNCQKSCGYCRRNATADWLEAVGSHNDTDLCTATRP